MYTAEQLKRIDEIVAQIKSDNGGELYQPVWGDERYDTVAMRNCEDRVNLLVEVLRAHPKVLRGEPLRVLELGCSNGYLLFGLNSKIAIESLGLDIQSGCIDLCTEIAENCDYRNMRFIKSEINLSTIEIARDFNPDVLICFSVLHHFCYPKAYSPAIAGDLSYAESLVRILSEIAEVAIFELALHEEEASWSSCLPRHPYDLLSPYPFIRQLGFSDTHLSSVKRPIVFASRSWCFFGRGYKKILSVRRDSHSLEGGYYKRSRTYIAVEGGDFLKCMRFSIPGNFEDYQNDHGLVGQHLRLRDIFPALPKEVFRDSYSGFVVFDYLSGVNLLDQILSGQEIDVDVIMRDLLSQLSALEELGYYHCDIRPWNVLNVNGKYVLIDSSSLRQDDFSSGYGFSTKLATIILFMQIQSKDLHFCLVPNPPPVKYSFRDMSSLSVKNLMKDSLLMELARFVPKFNEMLAAIKFDTERVSSNLSGLDRRIARIEAMVDRLERIMIWFERMKAVLDKTGITSFIRLLIRLREKMVKR